MLRSLPDDDVHFPERTLVHVRSFGVAAEIVVEQDFRVPEDAEGLVVMWQGRSSDYDFRDLVIERGGHTFELSWHGRDETSDASEPVRQTEAARLRGKVPGLELWGLAELPPGEQVTLRLRYQQELGVFDGHHRIEVPRQLGPADDNGPIYEGGAALPVELVFELDAAAPVAAYRVSDFGATARADGNRLVVRGSTTGVGEPVVVEHWIATEQPYASMVVDPEDGSFGLIVTAPHDIAPRPPEDLVILDQRHDLRTDQGLADEVYREVVARMRPGDRVGELDLYHGRSVGISGFSVAWHAKRRRRAEWVEAFDSEIDSPVARLLDPADALARPLRVVIITERGETLRPKDIARRRAQAQARGVELRVDVVAIGSDPLSRHLERLATAGGGKAVRARDFLGTRGLVDAITPDGGGLRLVRAQWEVPVRSPAAEEALRVDAGQQVAVFGQLGGPIPDHVELRGRRGDEEVRIIARVQSSEAWLVRDLHARARIGAMALADVEDLDSRSATQRIELAETHHLYVRGANLAFTGTPRVELIEPVVEQDGYVIEWKDTYSCRAGFDSRPHYVLGYGLDQSLFDPVRDAPGPVRVRVDVESIRTPTSAEAIEREVWTRAPELGTCLMRTVLEGEHRSLQLGVRLVVGDQGKVRWMERIGGQRPMLTTEDCLAEQMEGWTFPASGGPTTVEIDLRLTLMSTEFDFGAPAPR